MVHCKVIITMPDGSKGNHEGDYPDTVAATQRAIELFPQASKIEVNAAHRVERATTRPLMKEAL